MALDYNGSVCLLNTARAELLIDAVDLPLLAAYGYWTIKQERNGHRYAVRWINGRTVRLHRLLTSAPDGADVDHADRNGLNNRRGNLRVCSRSQNNCNQQRRSDNRSGFKGVYRHTSIGKKQWRSRFKLRGKVIDLGLFETAEQAYAAYVSAMPAVHGEFARVA
jgi:hypothetical protein